MYYLQKVNQKKEHHCKSSYTPFRINIECLILKNTKANNYLGINKCLYYLKNNKLDAHIIIY